MNKITAIIFLIFTITMNQFSQTNQHETSNFQSVDVEHFATIIADSSVIILDVRTTKEYESGHIAQTKLNIDVNDPNFEAVVCRSIPQGSTIAVYCRSGRRSKIAATIIARNGYKVYELNSGFMGWSAAQKPIE